MNSEQDTLPNNEQLLNAINALFSEMQNIRMEMQNMRAEMDARFEDNRLQMMSFDVRIDRIQALTHEVLNVSYAARADVKVLREEVSAWAKDVAELQTRTI